MTYEVQSWPYEFLASKDFPRSDQRGTVTGRLLVQDRYLLVIALIAFSFHFSNLVTNFRKITVLVFSVLQQFFCHSQYKIFSVQGSK